VLTSSARRRPANRPSAGSLRPGARRRTGEQADRRIVSSVWFASLEAAVSAGAGGAFGIVAQLRAVGRHSGPQSPDNAHASETGEDSGDLPKLEDGNVADRLDDLHRLRSDELAGQPGT
jgi:hypothetical protein